MDSKQYPMPSPLRGPNVFSMNPRHGDRLVNRSDEHIDQFDFFNKADRYKEILGMKKGVGGHGSTVESLLANKSGKIVAEVSKVMKKLEADLMESNEKKKSFDFLMNQFKERHRSRLRLETLWESILDIWLIMSYRSLKKCAKFLMNALIVWVTILSIAMLFLRGVKILCGMIQSER